MFEFFLLRQDPSKKEQELLDTFEIYDKLRATKNQNACLFIGKFKWKGKTPEFIKFFFTERKFKY